MKLKRKIKELKTSIGRWKYFNGHLFRKDGYCNLCGRPDGNGTHIHTMMGYGSDYDMDTVDLCICNECMDNIIRGCKIDPVTWEDGDTKKRKIKKTLQFIPYVIEAMFWQKDVSLGTGGFYGKHRYEIRAEKYEKREKLWYEQQIKKSDPLDILDIVNKNTKKTD